MRGERVTDGLLAALVVVALGLAVMRKRFAMRGRAVPPTTLDAAWLSMLDAELTLLRLSQRRPRA